LTSPLGLGRDDLEVAASHDHVERVVVVEE
jgi:hypothetical protein